METSAKIREIRSAIRSAESSLQYASPELQEEHFARLCELQAQLRDAQTAAFFEASAEVRA